MPISPDEMSNSQPPSGSADQAVVSVQPQGTPAPAPTSQQAQEPQPQEQQAQPQRAAPQLAQASDGTVSNNAADHPSIQKASVLRSVAETLAGGPRYTTSIDANTGATTRTRVPLSSKDIGLAIAMEAITGALSGLSVTGPAATGRAAATGFTAVSEQQKQAQSQQEAQANADFQNQSQQLARKASVYEANSRAILNVASAEQMGAEAIDKLADINRSSGVLDISPDLLDNGGTPMTQAELMDAMKAGKLSPTDQLGPVAGRTEITNADGSKRWEATHLIIKDPNTPMTLTQEQWNSFADSGVPGYPKGTRIPAGGVQIPLRMLQNANEIAASHYLVTQRLSDLRTTLDGTPLAKEVPTSIDFSKPGVNAAMQHYQRYVSHDSAMLADPLPALQAMGQAKRDAKTGQLTPNPDAKYTDTIASALGGWPVLQAAHDQLAVRKADAEKYSVIDSQDKAEAVMSAPKGRFSDAQVSSARNFVKLSQSLGIGKAVAEARAHAQATGADVEAMYKFGRNPITGERLNLGNAPDSMLVSSSGEVIPQNQQSLWKPTAQEKQTADTARQVLAISAGLQQQIATNPALVGPLTGRNKQALAKLGLGDAGAQKMLDDVSLMQSAVTKMHTGKFSNEILKKSGSLVFPGMNADQFTGALTSINDVATRYANEDRLQTVSEYKQAQATQPKQVTIPAGAIPGRDKSGAVVGYKLPNGQYVPLSGGTQ